MDTEDKILARMKPGCICKGIKLHRILQAIEDGAASFEEVAEMTGIGGGSCDSKRCGQKVATLLQKKKTA
jgi:bacterioferritin-associated ferredoxin